MFLLDTNVVSELRRPRPSLAVQAWFESQPRNAHYLSVVPITELANGVASHADPVQRHDIQYWIDSVLRTWFPERILDVTIGIAENAGNFMGTRQRAGKPLGLADALIAAAAVEHRLVLVTRNVKDFVDLPMDVYDPWINNLTLRGR